MNNRTARVQDISVFGKMRFLFGIPQYIRKMILSIIVGKKEIIYIFVAMSN